jgi:potassium-dependent mechanosensitive channel
MRVMKRCRLLLPALAALLLFPPVLSAQFLPSGVGNAQSERATGDLTESPRAESGAIPIERIPARLEESRELARRATEQARAAAEIEAVRQQVSAAAGQIQALPETPLEARAGADLRALESAQEQLLALRRQVNAWQSRLARRAADLSGWRDTIDQAMRSWQQTEQQAVEAGLPAELRGNIEQARQALTQADRRVAERQSEILGLQSTLAGWLSTLDDRLTQVDSALSQARIDLFRAEQPLLWQGRVSELDLDAQRQAWLNEWGLLRQYLEAHRGGTWAHLGLLILFLAGFVALARRVRRWTEEKPDLKASLAVFRHPLATALVLALLIGRPLFYPDAPIVFRELLGVVLILPLLRVLQLIVTPSLRGALYLFAALYLLMSVNSLLMAGTVFERYTLLLLSVAAAGTVAWIFRPGGRAEQLDGGAWWRLARLGARISLLILGIAVLANIGGLVSLAGLLTNAVISSAFTAIVLFAGVAVVRATVVALMQTGLLQHLNLVRWHGAAVDQWLMRILPLAALLAWVVTTTRLFRIEGVLGEAVRSVLFSSVTIGTIEISLGDILGFALAIYIGVMVSRFLRFVLTVDLFPRVTLPRGVAATIAMLLNYLVLGIAAVLAIAAAGIQLDRLAIILGALTIGIGFGLQNIVNNFVSGLILAFERPVQAGDTVEFSSMFGRVTRIGVRSSTVRTFDGAEVIVPNANLISNEVTNWTLSDMRRRMEIMVGVAYGSNPRQVLELLLDVARRDERLLETPAPSALFLGFGDSSLGFSLRAWTDDFDNFLAIKSDLTVAIHDALYAAGIEIPFPQRDLHLRSVDSQAVARIGAVSAPPVGDGEAPPPAQDKGRSGSRDPDDAKP